MDSPGSQFLQEVPMTPLLLSVGRLQSVTTQEVPSLQSSPFIGTLPASGEARFRLLSVDQGVPQTPKSSPRSEMSDLSSQDSCQSDQQVPRTPRPHRAELSNSISSQKVQRRSRKRRILLYKQLPQIPSPWALEVNLVQHRRSVVHSRRLAALSIERQFQSVVADFSGDDDGIFG